MQRVLAAPGVEHAKEPQFGAEVFRGGCNLLGGKSCGLPKEHRVKPAGPPPGHVAQDLRLGEGDKEVRRQQHSVQLAIEPVGGVPTATLFAHRNRWTTRRGF